MSPGQTGGNVELILPTNIVLVGKTLPTPDANTCQRMCQLVCIFNVCRNLNLKLLLQLLSFQDRRCITFTWNTNQSSSIPNRGVCVLNFGPNEQQITIPGSVTTLISGPKFCGIKPVRSKPKNSPRKPVRGKAPM